MVDVLIGWQSYETRFMGEKITMELRPLKAWAFYEMIPHMGNPNPKKKGESNTDYLARLTEDEKINLNNSGGALQRLGKKIFPDHVRNITNLTVNGESVTPEQIAEESIFMGLAIEISGQLGVITNLTEDDSKNSNGLSGSRKSVKKKQK